MPEYFQNIFLDFRNVNRIDFGFYYDSKRHRYIISINYGEHYVNVTRKEGETILSFLRILKEVLEESKEFSNTPASREFENCFEFRKVDPDLKNVRLPRSSVR